jgi:hypothetical protein
VAAAGPHGKKNAWHDVFNFAFTSGGTIRGRCGGAVGGECVEGRVDIAFPRRPPPRPGKHDLDVSMTRCHYVCDMLLSDPCRN